MKSSSSRVSAEALEIGHRLKRGLSGEEVYLFGSHARGEAGFDSDVDVAVVVPAASESRYWRSVKARRLVEDIHVAKDIVVFTREEWNKERAVVCSLAHTIAQEGVRLDA